MSSDIEVFSYFQRNRINKSIFSCILCKNMFPKNMKESDLIDHIASKHPNEYWIKKRRSYNAVRSPWFVNQKKFNAACGVLENLDTKPQGNSLENCILTMLIKDLKSFEIVEEEGFKEFINILNPEFIIQDSAAYLSMAATLYKNIKGIIIAQMKKVQHVSASVEFWTSSAEDVYITINAHFINSDWSLESALLKVIQLARGNTGEAILDYVVSTFKEYNIEKKIVCLVSDNFLYVDNLSDVSNLRHFGCFAHALQHIINEVLSINSVAEIVTKANEIVEVFLVNTTAYEILKNEIESNGGKKDIKLVKQNPFWLNSTYFMLEEILNLSEPLLEAIKKLENISIKTFSSTEIDIIKELVSILGVFHKTVDEIPNEDRVTISHVVPLAKGLLDKLREVSPNTSVGKRALYAAKDSLRDTMRNIEKTTIGAISTILDPNWKKEGFRNPRNARLAEKVLRNSFLNQFIGEEYFVTASDYSSADECGSEGRAETDDKKDASFRNYFKKPVDKSVDCLRFWKDYEAENETIFPQIAKKFLSVPASCVPANLLFSPQAQKYHEKKSRLNGKEAEILLFLHHNLRFKNDE